jgi:hypothetical protein
MGQMALIVLGLFVLVWIISAVVKASQSSGPSGRQNSPASRPRPAPDSPRVERTSETDIDRFMAEIDRLRRRGEGAPSTRPQSPRPSPEPRSRAGERRERERERRPRPVERPIPAPPPLPSESVPVLRPVAVTTRAAPAPPPPPPAAPPKPVRPAKPAAAAVKVAPPSPVLVTLQGVLKSKHGLAAALILAEIFGEPPGRRGTVRGPYRPKHG